MGSGMRSSKNYWGGVGRVVAGAALAVSIGLFPGVAAGQSSGQQPPPAARNVTARRTASAPAAQQTFPTAAEASQALVTAVQNDDQQALLKLLGPDAKDLISSGDETEDKNDREQFVQKYQQMHRLVKEPDGSTTLYIGAENWPTPIPLMHSAAGWYFDTAAGKKEILYRRIGKNELAAIVVCHQLVDAEKEYYGQPHDGGPDHQYAQKISSDPGKHNGLYWEAASGEPESPIGPLIASAATEGYSSDAMQQLQPFQGYYFRLLKAQGPSASGAARSYIVNGMMTGGFAFLAYPAEYRSSGVMTFIVNQNGIVYEKDLGPRTAELVKSMTRFAPDPTWRKAD